MINYKCNPVNIVISVIKEYYPNIKATIIFTSRLKGIEENECGCTTFPTNPSIPPLIELASNLPMSAIADVLSHEFAHIIAGYEAQHNDTWKHIAQKILEFSNIAFKKEFKKINNLYFQ